MTHERNIPFARPMLGQREKDLVAKVLDGTVLTHGPRCAQFESDFAERTGAQHAITVSSCTTGLQLSLMSLGVGTGDEVIVPAQTHVATAHAVEHVGAKPIFADVSKATGNIDPDCVEEVLSERTRAIIPVHYLGLPCDKQRLMKLAADVNVRIIEDCALALGAESDGTHPGTWDAFGCYSFYPAKHITTLEGGMVTTNDDELAARVRHLRAFGYDKNLGERSVPGIYDVVSLGHNFRMSEAHAAVGIGQLERLEQFLEARASNAAAIMAGLGGRGEIVIFPLQLDGAHSANFCVNIVLDAGLRSRRGEIIAGLNKAGIGTSVHYPVAVPLSTYYREKYGYEPEMFPVAEWMADCTISLPVGPHLQAGDAQYIVESANHTLDSLC